MITHSANTTIKGFSKQSHASPFSGVLKRALLVAAVLGSVLTLINQSDAMFGNGVFQYDQLALVYLTPFIVVAVSQVLAIRKALADARNNMLVGPEKEHPVLSALRHGIPARAVIVSFVMGSLASGYVLISGNSGGTESGDLPVALMAQGYILPAIFGLLSQTISYRRAAQALR